jgi:ATP/ADP translocase
MHASAQSFKAALLSVLVSAGCMLAVVFLIAGPNDFGRFMANASGLVVAVSLIAGFVRLILKKHGWATTALCGLIVAAIGIQPGP